MCPGQGGRWGGSFPLELASWTWGVEGLLCQREHRGTLNPELHSTLGLDHQLGDLNVHIRQDDFKWGENKDTNRKEIGQGGICALEVQGAMSGYLFVSVTFPDTMARV